jgi:hypothetical protein
MQTLQYNTIDKSSWPRGEWDREPDKMQWQDKETGLPCLIVRNRMGALCGYVGVSEDHPDYQKGYDDFRVEVHGGLTFANSCQEATKDRWLKWRESMLSRKAEIDRYPRGDAANDWRDYGKYLGDFDAWKSWCEQSSICHIPEAAEPDAVWWLGFDCAHSGDVMPAHSRLFEHPSSWGESYKSLDYVKRECESLARQLAEMATNKERSPQDVLGA